MKTLLIAIAGCVILLTGCRATDTPSPGASPTGAPSTTATPTPSPTPTLEKSQVAALAAAEEYWTQLDKIVRKGGFDQYAILKALRPTATGPVIQSNLNAARQLWKAGQHVVGTKEILTRKGARPQSRGTQVTVTFCQKQEVALADKKGKIVARPYPSHLVSIFDMRIVDDAFKVYEAEFREATKC